MTKHFFATLLLLTACMLPLSAKAATLTGVTSNNQLLEFDTSSPNVLTFGQPIFGLASNENVSGIDYRPSTGELYALGSFGNIYILDRTTSPSQVTANLQFNVNSVPAATPGGAPVVPFALSGVSFGFDFNPAADYAGGSSLRVVSNTDQNLAVNVNGAGSVVVATPVAYAGGSPANIAGEAYANTFFNAGVGPTGGTVQYAIDSGTDMLVLQNFNGGQLTNVGPLGVNVNSLIGFDILTSSAGNFGFASLDPDGNNSSDLYFVNLTTGLASLVGEIDGGVLVPHLAVKPGADPNFTFTPVPEPGSIALIGSAMFIGLIGARRLRR